jgi:hypothetical protein
MRQGRWCISRRNLQPEQYTIPDVPVRKRFVQVLGLLRSDRRQQQFAEILEREELRTRVLYALLSLRLISEKLSLDFCGICYVCGVRRAKRSTLKKRVLDQAERHRVLKRLKDCSLVTYEGTAEAPTVPREYRPEELERIRQKRRRPVPSDLAVLFEECRALIPERWKKDLRLTLKPRDAYQFPLDSWPTIMVMMTIARTCLSPSSLLTWAHPQIQDIHNQIHNLLMSYGLLTRYGARIKKLKELAKQPNSDHELAFAGFALCEMEKTRFPERPFWTDWGL